MRLPDSSAELLDLGFQCSDGIASLGVGLGILQYTPATFGPIVALLEAKQTAFNVARSAVADAFVPYHAKMDAMTKGCADARKILSISWGDDWTTQWAQAGWTNQNTQVPRSASGLWALCNSLEAFLSNVANADYVVSTPRVVFTAARYATLASEFTTAENGVETARAAQGVSKTGRTEATTATSDAIRGLVAILEGKLGDMDPRWDQFGLPRPGAKTTPAQPTGLTLSKTGTSVVTVLAQCPAVPLATYYRWFAKLDGVDAKPRFLGRSQDPLFQIKGQPAVGNLAVSVEAANEAGPGQESDAVSISLGA